MNYMALRVEPAGTATGQHRLKSNLWAWFIGDGYLWDCRWSARKAAREAFLDMVLSTHEQGRGMFAVLKASLIMKCSSALRAHQYFD